MRLRNLAGIAVCVVALWTCETHAQPQSTAVQLPTFSMFTTSTTVSVPDRGNVLLGGINRAATGRNEFSTPILGKLPYGNRLFKNVGIGSEHSASQMRVTAFIHDFDAMEEALMSQPTTGALGSYQPQYRSQAAALAHTLLPRGDAGLAGTWQPSPPDPAEQPAMTLADAQARRLAKEQTRANEAVDFYQRGERAEAEGKVGVAKIYYQMAARRAEGPLADRVAAKLDAIGRAETGSQYVRTEP
jgi:hypothetical protein